MTIRWVYPIWLLVAGAGWSCGPASSPAASAPPAAAPAPVTPSVEATRPEPAETEPTDAADPAASGRAWLGVELEAREPDEPGVRVRAAVPASPAERAGIAAGDVILSIEGQAVSRPRDVIDAIGGRRPNERLAVVVLRGEQERLFAVTLERLPADEEILRRAYVGSQAPAWSELNTIQGEVADSVGALKGQVVVIEFWATWCMVCRLLVPTLNDWHARFTPQGAAVVGITMDPVTESAHVARQLDMRYPLAADRHGETTQLYQARALPTLFIVDKRGVVRDVMVGYSAQRLAQTEGLIDQLLSE